MADPHIKSPMDGWDTITVIIYRSGFILAAIFTALLPYKPQIALPGVLLAATCCASSLHIYLKHMPNVRFARVGIGSGIFHFRRLSV